MDGEGIFQRFLLFAGLTAEAGEAWRPLCEAAGARFSALVREDVDPDDARLVNVAAAEACCQYRLARADGSAASFRVGEVSVSESADGAKNPAALRDELFAAAAGLLKPSAVLRLVDD